MSDKIDKIDLNDDWDWKQISIYVFLFLIFLLVIILASQYSSSNTMIKNGDIFPNNKTISVTNKSGWNLQKVYNSDSLGNSYPFTGTWLKGATLNLNIPYLQNYGNLEIYGAYLDSSGNIVEEVQVRMLNINNNVTMVHLYGTSKNAIQFETTNVTSNLINPLFDNANTTYKVPIQVLQNGAPFPEQFIIYNNSNSLVLTNTNDVVGNNPNANKIVVTSIYIDDSDNNPYLDTLNNKTFKKGEATNVLENTLLIKFQNVIKPGGFVEINLLDNKNNSWDIVLYNHDGKAVVTYSSDLDKSAILLGSIVNDARQPCRSQFVKKIEQTTANFLSSTIWPNGSTIKVGFLAPKANETWVQVPWVQAYIARIVTDRIQPHVNLNFQFVLGNIPSGDTSFQIRITMDPAGGCYSNLGAQSGWVSFDANNLPLNPQPNSMNYGWFDAPFNYTFQWNGVSYTTPASGFSQGGYGGIDSTGKAYGYTVIHEFCHALGMQHEHSTPFGNPFNYDKNKVYQIYGGPPNNWTQFDVDAQVLALNSNLLSSGSDFDYLSVMKYTTDTSLLIKPTDPTALAQWNATVGLWASTLNESLSQCDIAYLHKMYPKNNSEGYGYTPVVTCSLNDRPVPPAPVVITN